MRVLKKISALLILICIILAGCSKPAAKTANQRNLADIYNPGRNILHPDYFIQHINDTNSVLYIRVFTSELLFNQANEAGKSLAKIKVYCEQRELNPEKKNSILTDSITLHRTIVKSEKNSYFTAIPFKSEVGKKYSIKLEVDDEIRGSTSQNILIADKTSRFGDQNYIVTLTSTKNPAFSKYLTSDQGFFIQINQEDKDSLLVDYYSLDNTLPKPSFSSAAEVQMKTSPDTTLICNLKDTIPFRLNIPGIYHFHISPEIKEGLTLYNFGESFPEIKTQDDLLGPLVYLTTSSEFRDIRMEANRKLAVDNFWLGLSSDTETARELIRVFYKRVYYANLYFSSYKEGWKTDRGMIYIIFGPPRLLEKDSDSEKWTYFTKKGGKTAVFEFRRNENQFTNMDFILVNNPGSNMFWREAVDTWRKGKVYSIDYHF